MAEDELDISGIKVVVFTLFLILLFVVALEIISYYILKNQFGDFSLEVQGNTTMVESSYQVWEHPKKYSSWSGLTHFNNYGFRDYEDLDEKKSPNTTRIFIMGGSSAFGSQAMPGSKFLAISGQDEYSSDETISAFLEQKLRKKYPSRNFEVINAATNWSRLHQQLIHYLRKIRSLEPDLIISIDGQNDSHHLGRESNNWKETQLLFETQLLGNPKHKLRFLFKNSYTAYLSAMLIFRAGAATTVDSELVDEYKNFTRPVNLEKELEKYYAVNRNAIDLSVEEYIKNMTYFDAILSNDQLRHAFFLQPQTITDVTKKMTDQEKAIQGLMYNRIERQYFRINFFNEVAKRGDILIEEHGLNFMNMTNLFDRVYGNVYSDYCHFTPLGNQAIADFLLNYIEEKFLGLLKD